ncbi:MAG: histidine phosphatase family protein [Anaerolineae bacterium]|jgi:broad specificity phosphatase PhoE|nr:histidine phosphatase family protein [Anaerolineae bacterium]MBT3713325.1 histidine phosphatase family protein [Anaerolineae bacterium]MBT4310604.1 histidine phosphatase family protein [Anaerolineae bacterium]MBT4459007.1 histidine phosphatase family protein [Anaerolineae bacterium]MBT4842603.1 histidine phosphatase family protein [Anaerolineae bacterium]
MKPKRIILIRHGESEGNVDLRQYGKTPDFSLNLTQRGIEQAQNAGIKIKEIIGSEKISVYISPFFRTRQTFKALKGSIEENITRAIEDPRIREQEWGHLRHPEENKEIKDERDDYSTFYFRIPDGESGADVYDRVSTFLETLHRDFRKPNFPDNALIVTHGMTLRLFLMKWFHWSVEEFENVRNPKNCQIVVMEKQEDRKYKLGSELKTRKP